MGAFRRGPPAERMGSRTLPIPRSATPFLQSRTQGAGEPEAVVLGNESASMVRRRFEGAVVRALRGAGQEAVAVVTHGAAISTFVAAYNPVDPMLFWRSLTLPGAVRVDQASFRLIGEPLLYRGSAPIP